MVVEISLEDVAFKISNASNIELELVWLPRIMDNQTDDEKSSKNTIERNRIGLTCFDAPFVTSMYSKVKAGKHISDVQADKLRGILVKYKRQYFRMMKSKEK